MNFQRIRMNLEKIYRQFMVLPLAALLVCAALGSAWAEETVKIGFTGPLSGGAALYGKNVISGIEMAINEINAAGLEVAGKKVKLELVTLDDKYLPAEAAINARRLAQQSNVSVVFCPHSGGIFALQAINEQEKFIIMGYSSSPRVTEAGNKLTIRIPPSYDTYIQPFINYEMKRFGKRIGLLPGDHEYARSWTQALEPAWKESGGTVVSSNPMSYNKSADFYSGVSRVLAEKPEVLFVGGPSEPTALVVKQARELGFKGGFLIMDQAKLDEMLKITGGFEPLEGSIGVLPVLYNTRVGPSTFAANYRKLYAEREATAEASYNYSMTHVLAAAMKLAGTTSDAAAIRAKMNEAVGMLTETQNCGGGGFTGIDEKGGAINQPPVAVVEAGKIKSITLSDLLKLK